MSKTDIILIGAGGHCRSMIEAIESAGQFAIKGIVDKPELVGTDIMGYKVIGTDDDLNSIINSFKQFHITIGHIKSNAARVRLFEQIKSLEGIFPPIIASTAYVSKHATIGEGTAIMHNAFVNAGAIVGHNCIINTGSVIEHDCVIADHCHIATGAYINGGCKVGNHSFIGSRSVLVQETSVGSNTIIAAGAVLTTNADSNSMYAGTPATLKKKLN